MDRTESSVAAIPRRRVLVGGLSAAALIATSGCSPGSPPTSGPTAPDTRTAAPPSDEDMPAAVEDYIAKGSAALDSVRAVLVSVGGSTVLEHYRRGIDASSHLHVFSVTKSVTATLIGSGVADGLIGLDETLNDLLPEHRRAMSDKTSGATLRQLMSMSAGFAADPPDEIQKLGRGDLADLLLRQPLRDPPGTRFSYSDVSAYLAGAALHAALGRAGRPRNILTYAREKLFDPLGIVTRPAYEGDGLPTGADNAAFRRAGFAWDSAGNGIHIGAFGLKLTGRDLVKFGELQRLGGVWQGKALVGPDWVGTVTTPSAFKPDYGLFWWLEPHGGHPAYSAHGFAGQLVVVVPETETVVVVLSADDAALPISDPEALFALVDDVLLAGA